MSAPPASKLDGMQVLQHAFEDSTGRIRVDSAATIAVTGVVEVAIDHATDSIAIGTSGQLFTGTASASKFGLDVNVLNPVTSMAVTGSIDATILNPVTAVSVLNFPTTQGVSGDVTILNPVTSVSVSNFPAVQAVSGAVSITGQVALQEPVMIEGSINGSATGTMYGLVNNLRQQILATHDRDQDITYADFGTKDQRITQIDYTSGMFPGVTARKTLSYTLVGTRYRRDSITWSIV